MSIASIHTIPVWKKGATAAEWLEELAACARAKPERWERIIVVHEELNKEGLPYKTRLFSYGITSNIEVLGSMEVAQLELWEEMKGRR